MLAAHGGLLDLVAHLLRGVLDLGGGLLGAVAGLRRTVGTASRRGVEELSQVAEVDASKRKGSSRLNDEDCMADRARFIEVAGTGTESPRKRVARSMRPHKLIRCLLCQAQHCSCRAASSGPIDARSRLHSASRYETHLLNGLLDGVHCRRK